jgi:RNA polymerase sigma-70 factor (ECF subfamily)
LPLAPIPLPPSAGPSRDEQGLARLREQLVRAVARVCPRWLAGRADDVVQAAFLKLLARTGEGTVSVSASYLHKVAYSVTVDEIRRLRRRREVPLEDAAEQAAPAPLADPERAERTREIGRGLAECLRGLSEERRVAVTLHLQGHTVRESGRILGWRAKQVDNLVYRGLADLRRCLTAKGLAP